MDLLQWVALWTLIATQIGSNVAMYKYFDGRINRIYERFDNHKKYLDEKFVGKDICKISHDNTSTNLTGVETRMSTRFDKLEKRVEDSFNMIIDMLKK